MMHPGEDVYVVTMAYYPKYAVTDGEVDILSEDVETQVVGADTSLEGAAQSIVSHFAARPLTSEDEDAEPVAWYTVDVVPGRSSLPHGAERRFAEVPEGHVGDYETCLRELRASLDSRRRVPPPPGDG